MRGGCGFGMCGCDVLVKKGPDSVGGGGSRGVGWGGPGV